MSRTTKQTFCRICEALCGLEVDVEDGRVVDIRPDPAHVATGGFACPKGLKQHHLLDNPDRLRWPVKRVGGRFERVSWDDRALLGFAVAHPEILSMRSTKETAPTTRIKFEVKP